MSWSVIASLRRQYRTVYIDRFSDLVDVEALDPAWKSNFTSIVVKVIFHSHGPDTHPCNS
jgi:hypothetical protein